MQHTPARTGNSPINTGSYLKGFVTKYRKTLSSMKNVFFNGSLAQKHSARLMAFLKVYYKTLFGI